MLLFFVLPFFGFASRGGGWRRGGPSSRLSGLGGIMCMDLCLIRVMYVRAYVAR